MFIERIDSEYFVGAEDRGSGVMTSPINLSSFYDNSPPSCQPIYFTGHLHSSSRDSYSQPGPDWGNEPCSKRTKNHLSVVNGGTAMGTMKPQSYVGVRVKYPVKELIMHKYRNKRSWSSNNQIQMQEMSPLDVPHRTTVGPHVDTPTETGVHGMYPITCPGSLSVAVGNSFQIAALTPQPDPPPPPSQSPTCDARSGTSFFQWQITQQEEKVARLAPEQLVAQDSDGDTFLHIAVAQGRRALSYVLARNMAHLCRLDVKDHNEQSALQVSVAANQHLIAQDLITLGAQINTVDRWGRSPLHVCAEKAHVLTMQGIHKALEATGQKVNIETVNYDGVTALHTAVLSHNAVLRDLEGEAAQQSPQTQALQQRRMELWECIRTLLQMGASYRTKDHKSGRTALHMAAEEANVELLRLFLDHPDSLSIINAQANTGNTALHVVSALSGRAAQVDALKLLMRQGADPSIRNMEKEQPSQVVPEGPVGDMVWRILKGKEEKSWPASY